MEKKCTVSVGGQAVLEGVMMRSGGSVATAVRSPKGEILLETSRTKSGDDLPKWRTLPIVRGVDSFISSMVVGMKAISRTGEIYAEEEAKTSKFEKWLAKKLKIELTDIAVFVGVVLGLALAVALFMLTPQLITDGILKLFKINKINSIAKNLIAGAIRMIIFIAYILLVSLVKDIKRLFAYHGAEHKVINCYESGEELTPSNAAKYSTIHDRCGTTFLFLVLFISIIFFSFFGWPQLWLRLLTRILLLPFVAGISYEVLKWAAKRDNIFVRIVKTPGKWLQRITTKEPDEEMLEVAIAAFFEVMAMEADKDRPLKSFEQEYPIREALAEIEQTVGSKNEAQLILMAALDLKRQSELYQQQLVDHKSMKKAREYARARAEGEPLQYVLGEVNFYGYEIKVDKDVLIPRFETELLAEQAMLWLQERAEKHCNLQALELCTGSGAVAIAVKKEVDKFITKKEQACEFIMDAGDISFAALEIAGKNALLNDVAVFFFCGDMFQPFTGKKYDLIIANPPYVTRAELSSLDTQVADFEPRLALDGGVDGLDYYRVIAEQAAEYLDKSGVILLEVGIHQSEQVKELLCDKYNVEIIKDYSGIERIIKASVK